MPTAGGTRSTATVGGARRWPIPPSGCTTISSSRATTPPSTASSGRSPATGCRSGSSPGPAATPRSSPATSSRARIRRSPTRSPSCYVYLSDPLYKDHFVNTKVSNAAFKGGTWQIRFQSYRQSDSPYDDGYTSGWRRSSVLPRSGSSEWYGKWVIVAPIRAGVPLPDPTPTPTPPAATPTPTPTPTPVPASSTPSAPPLAAPTAAPTAAPSQAPSAAPSPAPSDPQESPAASPAA